MPKLNGWTPTYVIAIVVTIGAFVMMIATPQNTYIPIVIGWMSLVLAAFFGNALVKQHTDSIEERESRRRRFDPTEREKESDET